jgi:hypothetical protein
MEHSQISKINFVDAPLKEIRIPMVFLYKSIKLFTMVMEWSFKHKVLETNLLEIVSDIA